MSMKDTYTLEPDQHLSDCGVIDDILKTDRSVIVNAPPGSGKTHAAITRLKETSTPFVYVASVKALADEIGSRYDLPVYHYDADYERGYQVVTIPHHVHKLLYKDLLIWDGLSWMVSEYGFRPDLIDGVKGYLDGDFKQVIVLENTFDDDDPLKVGVEGMERVTVQQSRPPTPVEWVTYSDLKTALLDSISAYPDRSHLVSLYNRADFADSLSKMLEERGLQKTKVRRYNAEKGSRDETVSIMEGEVGGDTVQVVLSTYRVGFSTDVGKHVVHIVPIGEARQSACDIMQLATRFRNEQQPPIVRLYYNFPEPGTFKQLDLDYYRSQLEQEAERRLGHYQDMFEKELTREDRERIKAMEESKLGGLQSKDRQNLVRPGLSINFLQIQHHVFQKDIDNTYASPEAMSEALRKYNLKFEHGKSHERVEEAPRVNREEEIEEFERQVEAYFAGDFDCLPEIARRIQYLLVYFEREDAKDLMKRYGRRKARWSWLTHRIRAQRPELKEEKEVRQAIYDSFEVGERLTSDEIQERMHKINNEHDLLWGAKLSKTKATQTLKYHFKAKRTSMRVSDTGEVVNVIELLNDYPLPYEMKAPSA